MVAPMQVHRASRAPAAGQVPTALSPMGELVPVHSYGFELKKLLFWETYHLVGKDGHDCGEVYRMRALSVCKRYESAADLWKDDLSGAVYAFPFHWMRKYPKLRLNGYPNFIDPAAGFVSYAQAFEGRYSREELEGFDRRVERIPEDWQQHNTVIFADYWKRYPPPKTPDAIIADALSQMHAIEKQNSDMFREALSRGGKDRGKG